MKNIIKEFNLENYIDVPAAGKIALAYSCHKGEHFYNDGKLFNWKVFDYNNEEKPKYVQKIQYSGEKHNVIKDQMFKLPNGHSVGWDHFDFLAPNKTAPCFCTHHEDENPSAFVGRHGVNDSLFMKCDVCDTLYFNQ